MVGCLDLLLIGDDAYLSLPSLLLQLILGEAELGGVMTLVNLQCANCGHAYINIYDGFGPVSQQEWGLSCRNVLGSPVRP